MEEELRTRIEGGEDVAIDDGLFQYAVTHWAQNDRLFGFVIRVSGEIASYIIDEQITPRYSIGLFSKSSRRFRGINRFSYWVDAKRNLERGILRQNIMEDTGAANLREFKESLHPAEMLKEYRVIYRG